MTSTDGDHRVAILGGGVGSLATAWRLSEQPGYEITVYQRGWRLGGKGASSRGEHGRIEEHGLHVWLGYYDNAFRMMRECYAEVDRETTAPNCPIRTWTDAFKPSDSVGLMGRNRSGKASDGQARGGPASDWQDGEWHHWMAAFTSNDQVPGEPEISQDALGPLEFINRARSLVEDFVRALPGESSEGAIVVSASPRPPARSLPALGVLGDAFTAAAAAAVAATSQPMVLAMGMAGSNPLVDAAVRLLADAQQRIVDYSTQDLARRRIFELVDLVLTMIRGLLSDGLLVHPRGFTAVNDEEFCAWLRRHGAAEETFQSPLMEGVYDLVFGFRDGDPDKAEFAAGTGVLLSSKIFFDYQGSIFWKMQAGMGEVVFAPLYQALLARGVRFEFFHEVDELVPHADGSTVERVVLAKQAVLVAASDSDDSAGSYRALADYDGLPCFPAIPDQAQLVTPVDSLLGAERLGGRPDDAAIVELEHGRDFDTLVYGLSVGMVPHICAQLVAQKPQWAAMCKLGTVATQAAQLWFRPTESKLGWQHPGATITGYVKPFDTVASMSHLLAAEAWPDDDAPAALLYLCNTLPDMPGTDTTTAPRLADYAREHDRVRTHTVNFLETGAAKLFVPHAYDDEKFDWEHLIGSEELAGPARLNHHFWTANIDPSDRYVQSLPGTDRFRLRPDKSGYSNLILAGDWTDCGLNAGCIEAAAISGLQAANALTGHERWDRISGHWRTLVGKQ